MVASQAPLTSDLAHNQAYALTENQNGSPLIRRPMLSLLDYTSQGQVSHSLSWRTLRTKNIALNCYQFKAINVLVKPNVEFPWVGY